MLGAGGKRRYHERGVGCVDRGGFRGNGAAAVNRTEWQRLADERERDARALLTVGQWSGAYYLAGYAVECGLKSCVLVRLAASPELIFLEKRFSEKCWTHDLEDLVALADLMPVRSAAISANAIFGQYWQIVTQWSEQDRYCLKTEAQARAIGAAVLDITNGVLPWIRGRW